MNYNLFKMIKLFISFPLLIFLVVACEREGVRGVVIDPSGNAVDSVLVEVEESTFTATTNKNGEYLIDYAPGTFTLKFSKPGYTPQRINLRLREGTHFPVGPIVVFPTDDPIEVMEIEVTSLNPNSGSPGTNVVVNGKNFDEGMIVRFRAANSETYYPVNTQFLNNSKLSFTVPSNAACDAYFVYVVGGSPGIATISNSLDYTVTGSCIQIPEITYLNPSDGFPGTVVTVNGNNFSPGSEVIFKLSIRPFNTLPVTSTYVSNSQLRFTVPTDTPCNSYWVRVKVPEILQESNEDIFRVSCPTSANWQIRLERLHVSLAQERGPFPWKSDGDEPYFVVIKFQTMIGRSDLTEVSWSGFLDDDWAGGIDTGENQDIPQQMGVVTFEDVIISAVPFLGTQVLGAIVIAFEHDYTNFNIVEDVIDRVVAVTKQELETLIGEPDSISKSSVEEAIENIKDAAELEISEKILAAGFIDNDERVEYHGFVFVAAHEVEDFSFPGATTGSLTERQFLLPFIGANALYRVEGSVTWSGFTIDPSLVLKTMVAK